MWSCDSAEPLLAGAGLTATYLHVNWTEHLNRTRKPTSSAKTHCNPLDAGLGNTRKPSLPRASPRQCLEKAGFIGMYQIEPQPGVRVMWVWKRFQFGDKIHSRRVLWAVFTTDFPS